MENIKKSAETSSTFTPDETELDKINTLTLTPCVAEQLFVFKIKLCSNEVDRDLESFTPSALQQLAELYDGKTILCDHNPTTHAQIARIYSTSVKTEHNRSTRLDEPYTYIEAKAYIARTPSTDELITKIESGIKKEVSVGCAIGKHTCSICGATWMGRSGTGQCGHTAGKEYDGKFCAIRLEQPTDAYEVSFVAVPSQRDAGTTKQYDSKDTQKTENKLLKSFSEIFNKL